MTTRFTPGRREEFVALVADGVTIREAAAEVGISETTVARWRRRGERGDGVEHRDFALAVEDALRAAVERAPMTEQELRAQLERAIRKGSVQAMKVWLERYGDEATGDEDPFDALDRRSVYDDMAQIRERSHNGGGTR